MQANINIMDEKEDCQQVVFLSDAHSVLQALEKDKFPHLMEGIQEVAKERQVTLGEPEVNWKRQLISSYRLDYWCKL